jgi:YidC/Oxa1 family membrane protein insertase
MAYREHAFHQFDTVLCSTDYHIDEVHAICSHYGLDQKNVIPMRYEPIFDLALNTKHIPVDPRHTAEDEKLSILIAPTWGNSSLIESGVAEDVLAVLLENNFAVTLRPHPETSKHKPLLVTELSKRFRDYQDLTIDLDIESFQSVIDADILVTDWSGICFDFALGMSKPIIFFDTAPKIKNPDHFLIKQFVAEINLRKKLGLVVSTAADLPNAIEGIYNCKFKTEMSINDIFDQPASAAIATLLENVKSEKQTSP